MFTRIARKLHERNPVTELAGHLEANASSPSYSGKTSSPLLQQTYLSERLRLITGARRKRAETVSAASRLYSRAFAVGIDFRKLTMALRRVSLSLSERRHQRVMLKMLRQLLRQSKKSNAVFRELAGISQLYGNLQVAKDALAEYADEHGQTRKWFLWALWIATCSNDAPQHARLCIKARKVFGSDWDFNYERGRYFLYQKDYSEAQKWFESGLDAGEARERGLFARARCSFFLAEYESAQRYVTEFLDLKPSDYHGRLMLVQMANMRGEYISDPEFMGASGRDLARSGKAPEPDIPMWFGSPFPHVHRVLFWCDEGLGLGDEVMLLSLMPSLKRSGWNFAVAVHPRLVALAKRSYPDVEFIDRSHLSPESIGQQFTHWQLAKFIPDFVSPTRTPKDARPRYLVPPQTLGDVLRSPARQLTVGFSWKTTATTTGFYRSTKLTDWSGILGNRNCFFVPLQHGVHPSEREWLDRQEQTNGNLMPIGHPLLDMSADADHLAAVVASLDLLIAIDNTYVHLAGGLGIECWCMLSRPAFWHWPLVGENNWYRSVELFRQEVRGEWPAVFAKIEGRLNQFTQPASIFRDE